MKLFSRRHRGKIHPRNPNLPITASTNVLWWLVQNSSDESSTILHLQIQLYTATSPPFANDHCHVLWYSSSKPFSFPCCLPPSHMGTPLTSSPPRVITVDLGLLNTAPRFPPTSNTSSFYSWCETPIGTGRVNWEAWHLSSQGRMVPSVEVCAIWVRVLG